MHAIRDAPNCERSSWVGRRNGRAIGIKLTRTLRIPSTPFFVAADTRSGWHHRERPEISMGRNVVARSRWSPKRDAMTSLCHVHQSR